MTDKAVEWRKYVKRAKSLPNKHVRIPSNLLIEIVRDWEWALLRSNHENMAAVEELHILKKQVATLSYLRSSTDEEVALWSKMCEDEMNLRAKGRP